MSERACGFHCLDAAIHDECPYCTQIRIAARDAEIKRLRGEIERLRRERDELKRALSVTPGGCRMLSLGEACECGLCRQSREYERQVKALKAEATELERLQTAIDMLRQNVKTNAGNRSNSFAYVWMNVWNEFERRVDAKPNTKQ